MMRALADVDFGPSREALILGDRIKDVDGDDEKGQQRETFRLELIVVYQGRLCKASLKIGNGGFVPVSFTASGWLGPDSGGRGLAGDNVTGVAGVAL